MTVTALDTNMTLEFDDDHPLFTAIWEQSKAAREPQQPLTNAVPSPPDVLTIQLRIGDSVQKFGLLSIANTTWINGRLRMRTNWLGSPPVTVTAAATTEEKKA